MPLDAIFLQAVADELRPALTGAHIDKVRQPERDVIILHLRGMSGAKKLLICAGAADARVHFTDAEHENPAQPPMFCMLLRKHISGALITAVTQPERERVVVLELSASTALGEREEKRLILELMGRNSNVILVDSDGRVVDCLRRVDTEMSESRPVLPGLLYRLPPPQNKLDPLPLSISGWRDIFASPPHDTAVEKRIIASVTAVSPLIAREIAYRAYGDVGITIGDAVYRDGGEAAATIAAELFASGREPVLLSDADGNAKDFTYTMPRQYENALTVTRESGFSALLDAFYTRRSTLARIKTRGSNLERAVKNARDRAVRRVAAQRDELRSAGNREVMRETGDILTANFHLLKQGIESASLEDYYNGGTREIKLDKRLSPQQNAQKYYKEYTKARNAEKILADQITRGENEIEYLESVLAELSLAESERELEDIRRELAETGYVREQKQRVKIKPSQPRTYTAPSGAEVLVGRGNTQNDELTFKRAFKTDVWLHAQKRHGAHVILRTNGGTVNETDVLYAAALAAYYSEARGDKRVAVDWCFARYVKKVPGAKPGMVIYTDYRTVLAEPRDPRSVAS